MQVGAGRYQVEAEIGRGGMGAVYRAFDTLTGTRVALKHLKPELTHADAIERFKREGEALRALNHPNIVKLLDTIIEGQNHYLVMEYVSGGDLNDLLAQGQLETEHVLRLAIDLADALTRAHKLDIIHRDLKPANILIADDGTLRLTDFGVAYIASRTRLTDANTIVGTIDYLAPEALNSEAIDSRTDIWAFGVILFEMLARQRPFTEETITGTLTRILTGKVPDLEGLCPSAPAELVDLVYQMLVRDPNARIGSARHVGARLEDILHGRSQPSERAPEYTPVKPIMQSVPHVQSDFEVTTVDVKPPVETRRSPEAPPSQTGLSIGETRRPLAQKSTLFGRDGLVADVKRLFLNTDVVDERKSVTLYGIPGVGKTAVAEELAYDPDLLAHFNGILWIQLGQTPDKLQLLKRWGNALHIPVDTNDFAELQWRVSTEIQQQHLLLCIDDIWRAEDAATFMMGSHHILTTQFREVAAELKSRLRATMVEVPELDVESCVALLKDRADELNDPRYDANIKKLVEAVGRLPEALILVATRLINVASGDAASRLNRELAQVSANFSRSLSPLYEQIHLSVKAMNDKLGSDAASSVLRALALLPAEPNQFSEDAVTAISGDDQDVIYSLIGYSLIKPIGDRYTLRPVFADYSKQYLQLDETSYDRVIQFFSGFALQHKHLYNELDVEALNIDAALTLAPTHGREHTLIEAATALYPFWQSRGLLDVAAKHLLTAEHHAPTAATSLQRAALYLNMVRLEQSQGSLEDAEHYATKGLEELALQPDPTLETHLLSLQGQISYSRGSLAEARAQCWQALQIAERQQDSERISVLTKNLGVLDDEEGDAESARQNYRRSLEIATAAGLHEIVCDVYLNLGALEINLENYDLAKSLLEKGLDIANTLGNFRVIADLLQNLANMELDQEHFADAEFYFAAALEKGEKSRNIEVIAYNHAGLAEVKIKLHEFSDAEAHLGDGLEKAKIKNSEPLVEMITAILADCGEARLEQHDYHLNEAVWKDVLQTANVMGIEDEFNRASSLYTQLEPHLQ